MTRSDRTCAAAALPTITVASVLYYACAITTSFLSCWLPSVAAFTSGYSTAASGRSRLWAPIPQLQVSTTSNADNNSNSGFGGMASMVGKRGGMMPTSSQTSSQVAAFSNKSVLQEDALPWDWRPVMAEIWRLDSREIILFDGECNLCNGGVNMLLDMDTANNFRFCSLASKFGQSLLVAHGKHPNDRDSIMMVSPDLSNPLSLSQCREKSEAVMSIASKLEGAPQWVKAMTAMGHVAPPAVSDWFLQIIADNRHKVGGEYDQCRLDFDGEFEGRFLNDYEHEYLFEPKKGGDDDEELRGKYRDIMFS